MKIYTSYFSNIPNLEKAGIVCCAICLKVPSFFDGPNLASVAPSGSILMEHKKSHDDSRYKERYISEILCAYRFHPEYITDFIEKLGNGKDVALLCYERPEDFCHRHILAEWLNERIPGLDIQEYPVYPEKKEKKPEDDKPVEFSLF